jgi:hypothetical protein
MHHWVHKKQRLPSPLLFISISTILIACFLAGPVLILNLSVGHVVKEMDRNVYALFTAAGAPDTRAVTPAARYPPGPGEGQREI